MTFVPKPAYHAEAFGDRLEEQRAGDVDRFTTAEERAQARAFVPGVSPYRCAGCGRYPFPVPTVCFWCRLVS